MRAPPANGARLNGRCGGAARKLAYSLWEDRGLRFLRAERKEKRRQRKLHGRDPDSTESSSGDEGGIGRSSSDEERLLGRAPRRARRAPVARDVRPPCSRAPRHASPRAPHLAI